MKVHELKYISKYLVQYVPVKEKKPPTYGCVTDARILTSEKCAQLIFEREEKKKKEEKEASQRTEEKGERRSS